MGDRDSELRGAECAGERRIRVSIDQHRVRPFGQQDRLESKQHRGRLLSVRSTAGTQGMVGLGQPKLGKERPSHRGVPMLAGVHEDLAVLSAQGGLECGRLDELGSRPDDADDLHGNRVARWT